MSVLKTTTKTVAAKIVYTFILTMMTPYCRSIQKPTTTMMMWNILLFFFITEIANNVVLSLIARSIEDENGN